MQLHPHTSRCSLHALGLLEQYVPKCLGNLAIDYSGDLDAHALLHSSWERTYSISFPCRRDCRETNCVGFNSRLDEAARVYDDTEGTISSTTFLRSGSPVTLKTIQFKIKGEPFELFCERAYSGIRQGFDGTVVLGQGCNDFVKRAFEILEAYLARFNESR